MQLFRHHIKRKYSIRLISFLIAAFIVVGGFAIEGYRQAARYRWFLQTGYQHSFAELTTSMSELDTALQKGVYATSPCMLSSLLAQIYGKAMTAQLALGQLPYSNVTLEQTASFIAKTGDYALALSRSSTLNDGISDAELQGLSDLALYSETLSQCLQALQAEVYEGALNLEDVTTAQKILSEKTEGNRDLSAGESFQEMESDFPELPSLVYDGPFSVHLTGKAPLALEGLEYVKPEKAAAIAGDFIGMAPEAFTLISGGEGTLPTWGFSASVEDGDLYIEVSQVGGKVVSLFSSNAITNSSLTREEGMAIARDFLTEHGYPNMAESYWVIENNKITVNFFPVQDKVVIYPDLVKISVALNDGDIVGFEASGYLSNHRERVFAQPSVSVEEARQKVSRELSILSSQLALIPTGGEYEVLCYEFKCKTNDSRHVITYINAASGEQEKILLLLEDEFGTLAI